MWQLYSLGSITTNCIENILDKRAIKTLPALDNAVASFIRVFLYFVLVVPIGLLFQQPIYWYVSPGVILFGVASAMMATTYTVVIKRVNVTTIAILGYTAPLLFLGIDHLLGEQFSWVQILAILGLISGGIGFSLDRRLEVDRTALLALAGLLLYSGLEIYYLKWMVRHEAVAVITLVVNIWGWSLPFILGWLVVQKKHQLLLSLDARRYARLVVVAKAFDAGTSTLWGIGVTLTTVAQFTAMDVFFPPIMLSLALLAQKVFRVDLGEQLERSTLIRKTSTVLLIVVCGVYV